MKFILCILFISLVSGTYADNVVLPSSCKPLKIEGASVDLSAKKPLLVMINNLSNSDLWITHPVSEPSSSASWSSRLQAGNWSALTLDKDSFELSCIESKPGHEQQVSCGDVISVCEWSVIIIPEKSNGTFWAGENMSLSGLAKYLGERGFKLPALVQQ